MKTKVFCLAAALSCFSLSMNAQTISVADIQAAPNSTTSFTLDFSATEVKGNGYMSLDCDLTLPSNFSTTNKNSAIYSGWASAQITVGPAHITMASQYGLTDLQVKGLATVELKIGDVTPGDYEVTLSNITLGYNTADEDNPDDVTFIVSVLNLPTVELDENNTDAPVASNGPVKVIVTRTINANEWSTICLPFAMTGDQLKTAFGDDVILAKLNEWSFEGTFPNVNSMNLVFTYLNINDGLEANYPCMIKVSKAISEFSVNLVTIEPEEYPAAPDVIYKVQISTKPPFKYENYTASMYGTFIKDELFEGALFASSNKFWYVGSTNTPSIKGYRGYFYFMDSNGNPITFPNGSSARITMEFGDGTTDAIESVQTVEENDVYYNLRGLRVETPSKGIFIKNGKKVVVK